MGIELPTPAGEQGVSPHYGGEKPVVAHGVEIAPLPHSVEIGTTERPAHQEVVNGQGAGDSNAPTTQNVVANTSNSGATALATPAVSLDNVPVIAADEDLIEKPWVESVKRVIKDTRNDPYQQSAAISRLQADYLQKRYGKTVAEGDF